MNYNKNNNTHTPLIYTYFIGGNKNSQINHFTNVMIYQI